MRSSGILMPVFSLPSSYGIGCFSKEAYEFVDFLAEAGQTYWQILPLGPTSYGDSPYQSFSTFAGNPYFISPEELIKEGLLTKEECEQADFGSDIDRIDYFTLYTNRFELLMKAYKRSNIAGDEGYRKFTADNAYWLDDYALYMSIKNSLGGVSISEWPEEIRLRKSAAVARYSEKYAESIEFYKFLQYKFMQQWSALKEYANKCGVKIVGDIPIYVSYDSADTWANPELFELDESRRLTAVAGCPPDAFTEDGQLWGNPLYRWGYHEATGYEWWKLRMKKCCELYDVIRIDHFRGFDEFYAIPAGAVNAKKGEWRQGPGMSLFNALKDILSNVQIIAEDLGFITDSVRKLVKDTGFPNMKVLQFAFDENDDNGANEYLPHNYNRNSVVYTGTHDNETVYGWLGSIPAGVSDKVKLYMNCKSDDAKAMTEGIIRLALASVSDICIIPVQDYLMLDNTARINIPSTLGCNWLWRMSKGALKKPLADKIRNMTALYGRIQK